MAGKKYELGGLKGTVGGNRHECRLASSKNVFDPLTIDAKNALTVIYMLQSPEDPVVTRAVASLEVFAQKSPENLKLLSSLNIFDPLFPLVRHNDFVIKRFAQKLIGMLCSLEEFRQIILKVDNILNTFVDILAEEPDEVMQEYAALTLAELSSECHVTAELLKVDNCIQTLFLRIQSFDPDVEKNCLNIMNHLLNDINGIDFFIKTPGLDIKLLLNLTSSSYPVIQNRAIDVLKQLTAGSRDPSVLLAFRDVLGVETVITILENDEWMDLHENISDLLINVTENPDVCDYILQSGNLERLTNLLDNLTVKSITVKLIGILARMTQTHRGRKALHLAEMDTRFSKYLKNEGSEKTLEFSCYAIANLAQYVPALVNIMEEDPIDQLLDLLINETKSNCLRNTAAYALCILCNEDRKASTAFLDNEKHELLISMLNDISSVPVELCQNVIQTFVGISFYDNLKFRLINEDFFLTLLNCLNDGSDGSKENQPLKVSILECLSRFLVENEGRSVFNAANGGKTLIHCLHSRFASIREWAGHLVVIMTQSEDFVKFFIRKKGLQWMLNEKNTMHMMPSWQSAIEAIFRENLSAKFAYVGRLDLEDITKNGFFVFEKPSSQFVLLEEFFEAKFNPLQPVYFTNFSNQSLFPLSSKTSVADLENEGSEVASGRQKDTDTEPTENLQKYMKGADRNSLEEYVWNGNIHSYVTLCSKRSYNHDVQKMEDFTLSTTDSFLPEYLNRLRRRIEKSELLSLGDVDWWCMHPLLLTERARIIAEFVAEEMSGPNPDSTFNSHYKMMHLNELKYYLGTNILPLGFIRMGDYLERALLFKVLADRIGFPCALVRGSKAKAWIEIAIPVINIKDVTNESSNDRPNAASLSNEIQPEGKGRTETGTVDESYVNICWEQEGSYYFPKLRMECFKPFPKYFLKPNAIVDLVKVPGRILKMNSLEAKEYCK